MILWGEKSESPHKLLIPSIVISCNLHCHIDFQTDFNIILPLLGYGHNNCLISSRGRYFSAVNSIQASNGQRKLAQLVTKSMELSPS
jgi:hypothetical protein